jgi:hypothetical protein
MAQLLDDIPRQWVVDVQHELDPPAAIISTLADWAANRRDAE